MNARKGTGRSKFQQGQSLVEFALTLTIFLLALMLILDMGRGVYAYAAISAAAGEGARYGIVHPGDTAGVIAATQARARGLEMNRMTINVSWPSGSHVEVQVLYDFYAVSPLVDAAFGSTGYLRLSYTARMRI